MRQEQSTKKSLVALADSVVLDVQGLASLALDIVGTFVGTVIFEYTINNTDWYTLTVNIVGSSTTATGATAVGKWTANVAGFLKVRVRCSAFTSGSIDVAMRAVFSGGGSGSSGGGAATVADGADVNAGTTTDAGVSTDANGTMSAKLRGLIILLVSIIKGEDAAHTTADKGLMSLAVRESTPTDLSAGNTNGDYEPLQVDANGALWASLATLIAGENLTTNRLNNEPIYSTASITTQTTTTVKSGAGTLAGILIPTPVVNATIKIYDNTAGSGTVLVDTITLPAVLISDGPISLKLDDSFATGLTVVTGGATMAVDVYYR